MRAVISNCQRSNFTIILNGLIQSRYESNIFRDTKIEEVNHER